MSTIRAALANVRVPTTPDESVHLATEAVADAGRAGAAVICFPECFVPGYRWPGATMPSPDPAFLDQAWAKVAEAARAAHVVVILGTERVTDHGLQITARVIGADGTLLGWQDKGQIDPSEESNYPAVARPDGTLLCYQPYGQEGLLLADLDLSLATGLLASRCRTSPL